MANEKSDISDIVKKCKILLLDIEGTTTSISFVKDKLFPYAEANVKDFLDCEWEEENVKEVVVALRKLALEDEENKVDGVVAIPGEDASKEDQIEGIVNNVKWQMSSDRKVGPLKQLQGLIWKKGYDKGELKGHVYDDVSPALELWRSVEGQKVYIFSSGSVQAQKLLFGLSSSGDMLKLIDGHFDTAVGAKQEAASYITIAEKIGCNPEDILFLTDIDREAEAARTAGLQVALVSREGNAPLDEATANAYPVLYSFAELAATNKRKPDAQVEQPAKILKTDIEAGVKSSSDNEVNNHANGAPQEQTDKMEVDEEITKTDSPIINETEVVIKKTETIVEKITVTSEDVDIPVCVSEPIIDESPEKTDNNETVTVENDTVNSLSEPKDNNDENGKVSIVEETSVITEIKEVTNENEELTDVVEMIDDLEPVVEEPTQEIEDLENVGEVLAKECDEILSKVQNVTNLDNIPLKPLLNSIPEEVMEAENTDTNDIVDGILDTELELEMKQCVDIDVNSVQEISEPKQTSEEIKNEIKEAADTKENVAADVTKTDAVTTEKTEKVDAPSPREIEDKIDTVKETTKNKHTEDATEKTISSEQKIEENNSKEETPLEVLPTEAKSAENRPNEEKSEDTSPTDSKIENNSPNEAQVVASNSTEEKMEGNLEKQNVSSSLIKESNVTEEKSTDSSSTETKIEESVTTEENVKSYCPTDGKVQEASTTNEKAEKDSVVINTNEKSKPQEVIENTPTSQISDTCVPDESKIVADITKVEIKIDEDKMETDVSTPKTEDTTLATEEITNENRLKSRENVPCEKSPDENKEMDTDTPSESSTEKVTPSEPEIETPSKTLTEKPSETLTEKPLETLTEKPSEKNTETESSMEVEQKITPDETKANEKKITETDSSMDVEQTNTPDETKANEKVTSDSANIEIKSDNTEESKVNGNTSNGETEMVSLNGDSKEQELKSRLSMENGEEVVNGAKGDASDAKATNENSGDDVKDIPDVKVKTVAIDEPRNDPIEQPMEV